MSRICAELDGFVTAFRTRTLGHTEFPYVFLDATYLHVVVTTGVRANGVREVLGLVAAMGKCFQGAAHQRCRVHFARNLLALIPKSRSQMVAAVFRTIFTQPGPDAISAQWDIVRDQLTALAPKAGPMMDQANTEVLAFAGFPKAHQVKVWSNNPLERLNSQIKRRSRVVGIFPSEAGVIRLVGTVLANTNDEWQAAEHRYLSEESMKQLTTSYAEPVAAITNGGPHTQDS